MRCHLHDTGRIDHIAEPEKTKVLYRVTKERLGRKTSCDVVAFINGSSVVIADSRVPNAAFKKWYKIVAPWAEVVEAEKSLLGSRFDFVLSGNGVLGVVEVKGVNKAVNGYGVFPNAPSARARRHLETLARVARAGIDAMLVFIALRSDVRAFAPDAPIDRAFAKLMCAYRDIVKYRGVVPDIILDYDNRSVILTNPREAPVDACLEGAAILGRGKE